MLLCRCARGDCKNKHWADLTDEEKGKYLAEQARKQKPKKDN